MSRGPAVFDTRRAFIFFRNEPARDSITSSVGCDNPDSLAWSARHQVCSADQIRQLARAKIYMRGDLAGCICKIEQLDGRPKVVERAGQYLIVRIAIHHGGPFSGYSVKLTLNAARDAFNGTIRLSPPT